MSITFSSYNLVSPAVCGVIMTLLMSQKGLLFGNGSSQKWSRPAPAILPLFRACIRSSSFTQPPRATLIRYEDDFIKFNDSLLMMFVLHQTRGRGTRICEYCAKVFSPNRNAQKYCCVQCQQRASTYNYRSHNLDKINAKERERYHRNKNKGAKDV